MDSSWDTPIKKDPNAAKIFNKNQQKSAEKPGIALNTKDADDKSKDVSNELFLRVKQGTYLCEFGTTELDKASLVSKESTFAAFTKDGRFLLASDNNNIVLYSHAEKSVKAKVTKQFQILNVGVSSKPFFVFLVEKIDKENFLLTILDLETLAPRWECPLVKYKRENWPLLKFDSQDLLAFFRRNHQCIEILDAAKNFEILRKYEIERFNYFYVSPARENPTLVFTFVEHAQGFDKQNSKISIYGFGDMMKPIFSKNLEKAQEINPIFSPDGRKLLIMTQTYMDETGRSYYGEITLYYYDMENKSLKKVPTYEGPIHDVAWNPNSEEFIVISGFMPAYSVLFDKACTPIFEFGKHHRNMIRWSPLSNLVILGGFGNLSGDIEIWDTKKFEKVGVCKSNSAVSCIWAPDGRKFLTGVLNPRLRVDNNFKIFRYNGKLVSSMNLNHTELYEVDWRPVMEKCQDFNPSPKLHDHKEEKKEEKPRKLFLPPKGTGTLSAMMKADKKPQGGRVLAKDEKFGNAEAKIEEVPVVKYPPGYIPPEPKKKKKKNKKKKENNDEEESEPTEPQGESKP